jgi:hypothetical protein
LAACCEHYYDPSSFIEGAEFMVQLADCQLVWKNHASYSYAERLTNNVKFPESIVIPTVETSFA